MSEPRIVMRAPEELSPHPRNAKQHPPRQLGILKNLMVEYGFTKPVLVKKNRIYAGHGAVLAVLELKRDGRLKDVKGVTDGKIPTLELSGMTAKQARAYMTADNKVAELSLWDVGLLRSELGELQALDFDLGSLGFEKTELRRIMGAREGLTAPDAAPELPKAPVSKVGTLWLCGRHRVFCGDATNEAHVAALLGAQRPLLMVTDPPYGVNYDPAWRNERAEKGQLAYAARRVGKVAADDRADWREAWQHFPGDIVYCWSSARALQIVSGVALEQSGFLIRNQIIWEKPHFPISRGHYTYQHEPCWYGVRKGGNAHWIGDNKQSTVWRVALDKNVEGGHSTQKPVELYTRAIENHEAEAVYDPFVGSGTALIAAEMTGRTAFVMDIAPAWIDVTVRRWQNFTGEKAKRHGSGTGQTKPKESRKNGAAGGEKEKQSRRAKAGRRTQAA